MFVVYSGERFFAVGGGYFLFSAPVSGSLTGAGALSSVTHTSKKSPASTRLPEIFSFQNQKLRLSTQPSVFPLTVTKA